MFSTFEISMRLILLIILLLTSCSSAPTLSSPTPVPPQPTNTAPAIFSPFQSGTRYVDTSGDMAISFLDVVAFKATVNEEAEILDVTLWMRDIPETADRGQVANLIEYSWKIDVYLDPSEVDVADYYIGLNTSVENPIQGGTEPVPMHQLFENRNIYNSSGQPLETVQVDVNPDRDTLLFTGHVPGITSEAVFSFDMAYNEASTDQPDNYVPPEETTFSTPLPGGTLPTIDSTTQLVPIGPVRAFPGPEHYAGDVLSFAIKVPAGFDGSLPIYMALDHGQPIIVPESVYYGQMILPFALDTTTLTGHHTLQFITENGDLNEIYFFEVLPADQRPANEMRAHWVTRETDCCIFHYLSETAAARDIDFISEHFQQGAEEYQAIMKAEIDSKVEIHIIDRLFGNGGFGGRGDIVISYTDRYYGPTIGGEGLETLARHEFSHAAGVGLANAGDGVEFNYEGLAVYVAGGHYKPEPLDQRGSALFDLGYYVPVGEFLSQHELAYLYPAAMLTYIVEVHGKDKMWQFLGSDDRPE